MEQYAIFLDIDGTLSSGGKVHPNNPKAIYKAQKQGHCVFLNTGRSYAYLPEHVKECANFDGFICGLGADVRVRGKQIFSKIFSDSLLYEMSKTFLAMPEKVALFEGQNHVYFTKTWYDVVGGIPLHSATDFRDKYQDAKISKFTCETVDKSIFAPFLDELVLYDQGHYYELAQKGCTKAVAMQMTAEYLGIPKEKCIAMGDSINDEEMLRAAGIAVVTENGDQKMKKLATFVTSSVKEGGVADAIERILF